VLRVLPESQWAQVHPEQAWWSAQGRPEWEWRSAQDRPEAVRCVPEASPEAWLEWAARLLRAGCLAACLQAAAYPRRCPPGAALAWFEPAARPEPALAWCPRAAAAREARSSAGAQRRSAQPAASAAPGVVLPPEAEVVRYAQREAAAEASRASAAAVVRQPGAAAVLRARAGAAAGQAGAVELPREAAAGAVPRVQAGAAVARAGAAVRPPAVAAPRDAGQQREARASAWVFHPDQVHPWPAPPPSGRSARAMQAPRIAWP